MPTAARTYWLTTSCRIRRKDQSLLIERDHGEHVRIPITDVRDLIACKPVDVNTSVISLLNQHHINVHLLGYYGDYTGSLTAADTATSGETVIAQVALATDPERAMPIARDIVRATAFNVRRIIDRTLLKAPYTVLKNNTEDAPDAASLMGIEGNFRRSAWEVLDTKLPDWLQLHGRSRRPPKNAGNAFISYVNGIVYARTVTALRLTPLHTGIAFLHSTMERQRHSLALDMAEMFKPMFSERLLLRMASRNQLKPHHFDVDSNQAMLSDTGRKLVVAAVRDEFATTVNHRELKRPVAYDELLYLEALKVTRACLEGDTYKPFRIWW
ncbi:CRISPR-associated endonuclease Cas1 [Nocardiopsis changdeensis]|uniref:CRISPR-associated endonuclease Cas1 n=1 Tax=Nocardiopsis changdeensis TaxID=2831969 RepID=A0ABX8BEE7_9ACTN|nr:MULTISPECIES: CRISPR-associated endonuclease Cas1 [Nocardiopsis]MDE3721412.1 CRISPR-associated endonuclease Cas1 [Nocardiopsis sp. N85]QUX20615.1 CRISPR-associated endonuclease Cas1 [Nocardiopsis changdeensis]QYX36546.1 CRISPR-associated endonuclease Cas1 [Nocardiopsis sp. MT53]